MLSQSIGGRECVIAYASRTLTKCERRYCVTRKELLAVVHFVKHFKHYLYGKEFLIRSDHGSLRWLFKFKNPEGEIARWLETLSAFKFQIEHRPGVQHRNADALSRLPCRQCSFGTESQEQEDNATDKPEVKSATSVNVVELNTVADNVCLKIKEVQSEDHDLRQVIDWLDNKQKPAYEEISGIGYVVRSLWSQWDNLMLENGILYRRYDEGTDKSPRLQM